MHSYGYGGQPSPSSLAYHFERFKLTYHDAEMEFQAPVASVKSPSMVYSCPFPKTPKHIMSMHDILHKGVDNSTILFYIRRNGSDQGMK